VTFFDISALHAPALDGEPGSVFEVRAVSISKVRHYWVGGWG
jgi:hypothetical protein